MHPVLPRRKVPTGTTRCMVSGLVWILVVRNSLGGSGNPLAFLDGVPWEGPGLVWRFGVGPVPHWVLHASGHVDDCWVCTSGSGFALDAQGKRTAVKHVPEKYAVNASKGVPIICILTEDPGRLDQNFAEGASLVEVCIDHGGLISCLAASLSQDVSRTVEYLCRLN